MEDKRYRFWDIIIKGIGIVATAATIYFGLVNFNRQRVDAAELEFNRNFLKMQTEVYGEVCKNAGAIASNIEDPKAFEVEKNHFLGLYYGEMVLVEDPSVDSAMRELKSYVEIVEPRDAHMVIILKRKVIELSEACKASLANYKSAISK